MKGEQLRWSQFQSYGYKIAVGRTYSSTYSPKLEAQARTRYRQGRNNDANIHPSRQFAANRHKLTARLTRSAMVPLIFNKDTHAKKAKHATLRRR
jgi:hypothetical protein